MYPAGFVTQASNDGSIDGIPVPILLVLKFKSLPVHFRNKKLKRACLSQLHRFPQAQRKLPRRSESFSNQMPHIKSLLSKRLDDCVITLLS